MPVSRPERPPSVDALARSLDNTGLPAPLRVMAARQAIAAGDPEQAPRIAAEMAGERLGPIVNATGVLLHTNLGRAPLERRLRGGIVNVELDRNSGRRGQRTASASRLLCALTGAEAATVVNNGAGALLLALAACAKSQPVIVSRGELVEIGGGFRIPEVLAASGADLVEVGSTNKTRLSDYERALSDLPSDARPLVLKVHQSNYRIVGFTSSVPTSELAKLGPPVVVDLGSGLLDADTPWLGGPPPPWLNGEPAARQSLEEGASLVTFSGDKLLGGPQAGLIAGREAFVTRCSSHPLFRALRPGGLVLAELQATLSSYAERRGSDIAFWRMATAPVADLRRRAEAVAGAVGEPVSVCDCDSTVGAGSVPGQFVESVGLSIPGDHRGALLANDPPVVARVAEGCTLIDLRSVEPEDDATIEAALKQLSANWRRSG